MDLILQELLPADDIRIDEQHAYCVKALEKILQSDKKDYMNYFSSRAESGSIVEDIAELDAHMATLERQVRSLLIENKSYVIDTIMNKSKETITLEEISNELEQLWELNSGSEAPVENEEDKPNEYDGKNSSLLEDFLMESSNDINSDSNSKTKKIEDDEFHRALKTLRQRVIDKNDNVKSNSNTNLTMLFENLTSITDLMELPSLAQTCIKTGHYQEAIMLYTHTMSLKNKFPDSSIIRDIGDSVQNAVGTTMLTGLVKLLCTNLTMTSIKKILQYLIAIPPFSENNQTSLLIVYLSMRLKFIQNEIESYSFDIDNNNDSMLEISVKRQIEVVREHIYMSLTVYDKTFDVSTTDVYVPLNIANIKNTDITEEIKEESTVETKEESNETEGETKMEEEKQDIEVETNDNENMQLPSNVNATVQVESTYSTPEEKTQNKEEDNQAEDIDLESKNESTIATTDANLIDNKSKSNPTNPLMLKFVSDCINFLLKELVHFYEYDKNVINNSVCLQLVYCSFRLNDLNGNYHRLFLNKIAETKLFTNEQLQLAIAKRTELASKYSFA
ncbi:similar to Saccharomyces cerevisiae YML071C COG8 Component of the conserved oligomeric Golgi complex (Cog1p through Cog8p) [Maudiozyma saulgeensis]|uniref:Conserved oligomeric Golgi complex subunit 8 n=1 Tax=Maudiozyma saulgeensis TaxID=1789683 RepID=A0A1X7QZG5_9SACH|nr:similar to Saccharomyces cerevisiae YML071C COG8 Component of the conserved oligomeric Golgi complex (Cog1p through Cog8p) [Kazachstania saulgeensis]